MTGPNTVPEKSLPPPRNNRYFSRVLRQKPCFFLLLAAVLLLGCGQGFAETVGRYTPCIIRPSFLVPVISPALVHKADIVPPKILHDPISGSLVERPEIIKPRYVRAFVVQPVYDGCAAGRLGYMETIGDFRNGFTMPFGALPCCGGASPAQHNTVARPWSGGANK